MNKERTIVDKPFSLRLTVQERTALESEAGRLPLGAYIRTRLFTQPTPRKRFKRPCQNDQVARQLLVELGRSKIGNNLNQIAKAIHSGALVVPPETAQAVDAACGEDA